MPSNNLLSKLKSSLVAMIFGFTFILAAIAVQWWNEGRTIKTYKGLKEGSINVYSSQNIDYVSPENEGKLLHLSGKVSTKEKIIDTDFGVEVPYLKLKRKVEMYQWIEKKNKEDVEGSEDPIISYSYEKKWSGSLENSEEFNQINGHENPKSVKYLSYTKSVKSAYLGAHELNSNQISRLNNWSDFNFTEIKAIPNASVINSEGRPSVIFEGQGTLEEPSIGDLKISFKAVQPTDYSIIAAQTGQNFSPFKTKKGTVIDMLELGNMSSEAMFKDAIDHNDFIKWLLRIGGFLFLFLGVRMLFSPLTALTGYVPILRTIASLGVGLIAFVAAFCLSCIVIGFAWVFYRPILGGVLLAIGLSTFWYFRSKGKKLFRTKNLAETHGEFSQEV